MVFTATAGVHELEAYVPPNTLDVFPMPFLGTEISLLNTVWLRLSRAWVQDNLVGWAVRDVETAAVSFASRNALGKMLVRVSDTPIVLFFKSVLCRARNRISSIPKHDDKFVPLFVG